MKKTTIVILILAAAIKTYGQKPVIDTSVSSKWISAVGNCVVSNDGNYLAYGTKDDGKYKTTLRSIDNSWKKEIIGASLVFFADNDRLAIGNIGQENLYIQTLGSDQEELIDNINSFKVAQNSKAEWLLYQLKTPDKELVVRNLFSGKQTSYSKVTAYQFITGDRSVLLQQELSDSTLSLSRLDLVDGTVSPIWKGKSVSNFVFTADGKGLAFTGSSNVPGKKAVWYYHEGDAEAQMLFVENTPGLTDGLSIQYLIAFDITGEKLFFMLKQKKTLQKPNPNLADVDVYSYKDPKLQSQQLKELQESQDYTYVYNLSNHQLTPLAVKNERLPMPITGNGNTQKMDFVLVRTDNGGDAVDEWNWNPTARTSVYLVSTADGTRKCLGNDLPAPAYGFQYQLSPDDRYFLYYDVGLHSFFSYNIASGAVKNITKGAKADWLWDFTEDWPDSVYEISPQIRWAVNDEAVFISSKNDIYQADPSGALPVISLTGDYGRRHHLRFRLPQFFFREPEKAIDPKHPLLLSVFDEKTEAEGFCQLIPGRANMPKLLKMLPYHANLLEKAKDAEVYTLDLESAESSPNWFLTRDFKTYTLLTDVHPERAYNWLSSELIHFKTPDGKATQGILFKPENFDPKKKYPVIFEYYERNIVRLHQFSPPGSYSDGSRIDIPTYVSNGYLVFTPDIYYKVGHPGQSAYNTIVSAAEYLSQFSWVDKARIGLMGHSFGGFETNYVITHSHLFAAAVSMSGMTDFVSAYGSIIGGGVGRQHQYELYRDRIGATLWQRPDLYFENSPVLKADQVTTPVLLMANKKDDDVPYEQGFEFFTALRRLGKKAWMLQYDNGGHQIFDDPASEKDLTLRIQQFFDYYLKRETPPKWMVSGIPASEKQIDSGFEADTTGRTP